MKMMMIIIISPAAEVGDRKSSIADHEIVRKEFF